VNKMIDEKIKKKLIASAKEARENAYVPYSNFPLGAAILTKEGKIFTGVNIENSSYGLTICAERAAIFNAISQGYKNIIALALVSDTDEPVTPCGACRQVMSEFSSDIKIIMCNLEGKEKIISSNKLLPGAFSGDVLNNE